MAKANQVQEWAGVESVKSRLVTVRGQLALLDRDVAALYGVEPREVNQAVRNNPAKFPEGYVFPLTDDETKALRSKILILDNAPSQRGRHSKHGYKVFTEKGLYMLATILKGERATQMTIAIIETYAQVRGLKRELVELHGEKDRKRQAMKTAMGMNGLIPAEK